MDPKLIRYYKKKLHGGRSVLARTIDLIMLRIFIFFLIFMIILYLSLSLIVSLLIAFFVTAAISIAFFIYNRKKTEKYILKDMVRIKQKCLLEKLTFMRRTEYAKFINELLDEKLTNIKYKGENFSGDYVDYKVFVFHNHPKSECGIDDVLKVYRDSKCEKLMIWSLSDFSDDVKNMCSKLTGEIKLIEGEKILYLAGIKNLMPDEPEAEDSAAKEVSETIITFQKLRNNALSKTKIKGYMICGIVIMLWPIISGFEVYYPITAMICFILALVTYRKSKRPSEESAGIGIS